MSVGTSVFVPLVPYVFTIILTGEKNGDKNDDKIGG